MAHGIALVFCVALVNALRRTVFNMADDPDFGLASFAEVVASGLLVGLAMLFALFAALRRFPQRGRAQYLAVATAILASSALGVLVKDLWDIHMNGVPLPLARYFPADWLRHALPGGLLAGAYLFLRQEAENAAKAHQYAVDSARMASQVAEARLRVLEAQIEPHFLFNTLAIVKRLFQTDAAGGERMLDDLMRYLSVALPQMRSPESTLGNEAALASAYLGIQRLRMGRRMAFTMDIPEKLGEARLPPFMVLTLIENAIKHGLGPLREGGALAVAARSADGMLLVEVRDTGHGFAQTSGAGTGLANIRARLALVYGPRATLRISRNEPRGVVATLAVPLELMPQSPAE